MPHYCCELCNISTKLKYDFKRHLNTNKHRGRVNAEKEKSDIMVMNTNEHKMNTNEHKMNTNEHKKNISHSCSFCSELFKTIPSKRRHELHYCKNRFDNMNYKKMFLESKKQMENEKKHLKKQIEILLTKVGDTTINNTQNIQLNSYGKEDLEHITDTMKTQLLRLPYGMIPKMIEAVHFNEDKPENKNIVLPNKKDNKIKVYSENKWIYKDKDELLHDLIDGKYFILDNYYDSVIENLSNSNKLNYEKFRTFFDENDKLLHDQLKKECEFVLLNNR
jgi:hypothetical protein